MTRIAYLATLTVVIWGLAASEAAGWGERAQRSIAYMALQVIERDYPKMLRDFDRDIVRGAQAGYEELADDHPMSDETDVMVAINTQIQLMREVRRYGINSYFAYRMGILSSLTADLMMPYGMAWNSSEEYLRDRINADIDAQLDGYGYVRGQGSRTYIRNTLAYFAEMRTFYADNKQIIAEDYRTGAGYNGLLKEAGPSYFNKAIVAVADVWHTVLRAQADASDRPASRTLLTWYFVKEIRYMLEVKKSVHHAKLAHRHFQMANPGILPAYEEVGDLYYQFGSEESVELAVSEWRTAYSLPGAERLRVGQKLSQHFMRVGRGYFEKERYSDTDLPNALEAFQQALSYDRQNSDAAALIQQVNRKIEERRELYQLYLEIISKAEAIREEATRAALNKEYGTAIARLRKGVSLFEGVGEEFPDLYETAKRGTTEMRKEVEEVIQEVLTRASEAIDEGDSARDNRDYPRALVSYERVQGILAEVPEDAGQTLLEDKVELEQLAERKIRETKEEQADFERRQREQVRQPGAPGARPGQGAPGARPGQPQGG
jgi:tetratricopeptide (TPR) repeat protein